MSAGGLSYSGITNYGKATLPSVDNWGSNMNIIKDPPKSIYTRRIDKVGQTSLITDEIDGSNDRFSQAINLYARGVNPSVSVSYGNQGNNYTGGMITGGSAQPRLPYTVAKDGAFRPPIMMQENLLPLSRQPRVFTSAATSKKFAADYTKSMRTCGTAETTKEVKNTVLKACVRPTATFKIETPIKEPYEVKNSIKQIFKIGASSGIKSMNVTQQNVQIPTKEIYENPLHANAQSNISNNRNFIQGKNKLQEERYLQDVLKMSTRSNISSNRNFIYGNNELETDRYLQNVLIADAQSNISNSRNFVQGNNNLETDRYLQNVLIADAQSNLSNSRNFVQGNNNLETDRYLQNVLIADAQSNISNSRNFVQGNNNLETDRYVQNSLLMNANTNPSTNQHYTNIEDLSDLSYMPVKDISTTNLTTPISGLDQIKYIHEDITLERSLPEYSASTNYGYNIHKQTQYDNEIQRERNIPSGSFYSNPGGTFGEQNNIGSRDYKLIDKLHPGGYEIPGQKPMLYHENEFENRTVQESEKVRMARLINEQMSGRHRY